MAVVAFCLSTEEDVAAFGGVRIEVLYDNCARWRCVKKA